MKFLKQCAILRFLVQYFIVVCLQKIIVVILICCHGTVVVICVIAFYYISAITKDASFQLGEVVHYLKGNQYNKGRLVGCIGV